MGKRRIEKKIEELESDDGDDGFHILILYEGDDGTIRNADGEPVTEEMYKSATVVIDHLSEEVVRTWPNVDDDGDSEVIQP